MKVLIVAYDFPPYVSVGGLRPYSWYKYFKEFGIEPIVVTRQWDNKYGNSLDYIAPSESKKTVVEETKFGKIIRAPYFPNLANRIMLKYGFSRFKILRKAISGFYDIAQWFLPVGPKYELYKQANSFLKHNKVDAIIATGEPFVLFHYASLLSKKFNTPWIADYRDPWSQNKARASNIFALYWNMFLEKRALKNANFAITVSDFFKNKIQPNINNTPFHIIPNGFESINLDVKMPTQNKNVLSIGFVGTIYKWHPIESFLQACTNVISSEAIPKLEINFYGISNPTELSELVNKKFSLLKPYVNISPKIPNRKLVEKLFTNNALLLFNYYSYMGTKIYDYLAVKRQILLCYNGDEEADMLKKQYYNVDESGSKNSHLQEDLIKATNSGIVIEDKEHLEKTLISLHNELLNNGSVICNSANIERYSRKQQTKKFVEIIKNQLKKE